MALANYMMIWAGFTAVVALLALYRFLVSRQEDDHIYIGNVQQDVISKQITVAKRLDMIERWGKSLTAAAAVSGLALVLVYLNRVLESNPNPLG